MNIISKTKHPITAERNIYLFNKKIFSYTPSHKKNDKMNLNTIRESWRAHNQGKIFVIGDSHVNFFSGNEEINFIELCFRINSCNDKLEKFATLHLGPALAYNLINNNSSSKAKEKIEFLIDEKFIFPEDRILFSFGEIDLRVQVMNHVNNKKKPLEEVIDTIVNNYFSFLIYMKDKGFKNISLWAPIPTGRITSDEFPMNGSEEERNIATQLFILKLKEKLKDIDIKVFSLFEFLIDEKLITRIEYLADNIHLSQNTWEVIHSHMKDFTNYIQKD